MYFVLNLIIYLNMIGHNAPACFVVNDRHDVTALNLHNIKYLHDT